MMAVPNFAERITAEQYLATTYRPDCDYTDGFLEERNLGEFDHARIQGLLVAWFIGHELDWTILTLPEQRVQVSQTRFRIPDICILSSGQPVEQIITQAPLICIEILSRDDSIHRMRERIADYHRMGVEHVWLIDPASREGHVCTDTGWNQPSDGNLIVPGSAIYVPLAQIFASLNRS